jgi:hypothetical protein
VVNAILAINPEHPMDVERRRRLIDKATALNADSALPAVPMDEFFEGNTDDQSMGRGMQTSRDIPITDYHKVFRSIRDRSDVQEVFVVINELWHDRFPEFRKKWPQAHIVNIITSAPVTEIEKLLQQLEPRWVDESWCYPGSGLKPPMSETELLPGMRPVCVELL